MNNISKYEIELKNAEFCVKKCSLNELLLDFKKCYNICDIERRRKDLIMHRYIYAMLKNIKDPQINSNKKTLQNNHNSDYILPDFYYKSKDIDLSVDAKKQVGAMFGRNK